MRKVIANIKCGDDVYNFYAPVMVAVPGFKPWSPTNGVKGWSLERYEWDPETGVARFRYEHEVSGQETTVPRYQPNYFVK